MRACVGANESGPTQNPCRAVPRDMLHFHPARRGEASAARGADSAHASGAADTATGVAGSCPTLPESTLERGARQAQSARHLTHTQACYLLQARSIGSRRVVMQGVRTPAGFADNRMSALRSDSPPGASRRHARCQQVVTRTTSLTDVPTGSSSRTANGAVRRRRG